MSHTTVVTDDDGREWALIHNGDWSGGVEVHRIEDDVVKEERVLPGAVVRKACTSAVVRDLIGLIEQWDGTADPARAEDCPDVVVALENAQAAVEQVRTQVERLQSFVQLGFSSTQTRLYSIEAWHLERLKTVATRLREAGERRLPVGEERAGSGELLDAAHDIMVAVRFAEAIEALRGPGEPYVHMTPRR